VGVAVKVTLVPAQNVLALAPTLTDGVTFELTVKVFLLEVAVLGDGQVALLVITTQTLS
jgi:hypothetical protein